MNKNLMIGLGVLAVAGIAYYMYKKPKAGSISTEPTSKATGKIYDPDEVKPSREESRKIPKGHKKCACSPPYCSESQLCKDFCSGKMGF
jgi:hypothetical protein